MSICGIMIVETPSRRAGGMGDFDLQNYKMVSHLRPATNMFALNPSGDYVDLDHTIV